MTELFRLLTPVTYWLLIVMWSFILVFYIKSINRTKTTHLVFSLLLILSIDAFRTLFESVYFGFWYTSLAGMIPRNIADFLMLPEMVIIPKLINVFAAILVIFLLLKKWLPEELKEKQSVRDVLKKGLKDKATIANQKILLEKAQELGQIGSWELDLVNDKLYWTDENCRIFGVEPGTVANYEIFLDKVHPDDRDYVNEEWMAGVAGKPYDIEHRLLIDGEVTWVREKADLYFNDEGEVISAIGLTQDVSKKKLLETNLHERVKELDCLYGIAKLVETEDSLEKILQGTVDLMYLAWQYPDIAYVRIILGEQVYSTKNYRNTSWKQSAEISVHNQKAGEVEVGYLAECPLEDFGPFLTEEQLLLNTIVERLGRIIERHQAEQSLKESESNLLEAQRIAKMGRWELNLISNHLHWSPSIFEIFEIDPSKFEPSYDGFLEGIHPEDRELVNNAYTESLQNKKPYQVEHRLLMKDGRVKWVHEHCETDFDETGKALISVGVVHDITDQKKVELDRLNFEKQILQTQKLESLGVLAGGIAHDFNNILMGILGYADLALSDMDSIDPAREFVQGINDSSKKAAGLVKQMLAYSGKGKFSLEPIDLNHLIDSTIQMLNVSISKNAVLRFNYSSTPVFLEGDPSQIRQIIMNLVINASDAVGKKSGIIAVTTGSMYCDREYIKGTGFEAQVAHTAEISEGMYTFVEVADTGAGMSEQTLARIFEPFFTTKFTGRGLGLSAVLGIVGGHHGMVKIYSEEGKGTTFKVLFPLFESVAKASAMDDVDVVDHKWRGEGTFLIADDEEAVRTVGKHMLKRLGYEVLTAADGREAIEIYKENQTDIVGVLLDLTMPHKDGAEVFSEIRKLNPAIKVVLASGYNEQDATQQFVGKGLAGFIQKPYVVKELIEKIIEVMDKT